MTPEEAAEMVLNALSDRPSGPDPREVLAAIQAQAWDEGESAGYSQGREWPDMHPAPNPYRRQA